MWDKLNLPILFQDLLEKDHTLRERTVMEVSDIILLLEFCLNLLASQAGAHLPPREGSSLAASQATQAGRCSPSLRGRKQFINFPGRCLPFPQGRKQFSSISSLSGSCSPSLRGRKQLNNNSAVSPIPGDSASSQAGSEATTNTSAGESPSQAGNNFPTSQAGSQITTRSDRWSRHSARQRALQASQGNSTASQADSAGSQEGSLTPNPPNRLPQGSSPEDPNPKWVINLSSKSLTPAQRSVLANGPNFVVSPKQPPNLEYITAIEAACTKLSQQDDEELRAEVNRVLRSSHPPKPNLTEAQNLALREPKRDRDCIVLTADKGIALVIMDRQDYINKANSLLNQNTYSSIPRDPTNSIKNKLISILKRVKNPTGLDSNTYKSMYPTGCVPPSSIASPGSINQTLP